MTEEEARAKLRLIEINREKLSAESTPPPSNTPPVEVEGEGFDMQDVRGIGGALLKGQMLGYGDEFIGAVRAGLDSILPETEADRIAREITGGVGEQSLKDRYKMHRDDARASDEEFARENPGSALGLTIAGGIASPVNRIAPGFGTSRMGAMGRGALEGAVAGYGESTEGNALKNTLMGGGVGGAFGLGVNSLGRVLGRTKGIDDLDQVVDGEKRFLPLHLAADSDSLPGRIYRNTLGRSSGGTKLARQEQPWLDDAAADVKRESDALNARKLQLDEDSRVANMADDEVFNAEKRALDADARQAQSNINNQVDMLEAADLQPRQAVPKLPKAVKAAAVNTREAEPVVKFRREAATESIPVRERGVFDDVDIDNPEAADDVIYDFWQSDDAFGMVKGRDFDLNDDLRGFVREVMETPESRSQLGEVVNVAKKRAKAEGFDMRVSEINAEGDEIVRKMTDDEVLEWAFEGQIDGGVLMELRNIYARGANAASGMSKGAQRKVASAFDRYIARNVDDADEYFEHIAAYPNSITHGKAVAGNKANAAGGRYTIDEHQAAGKPLARRGTDDPSKRSKRRPMQPQARAARAELEGLEPPPAALPDATAVNAAREANVGIDAANQASKQNSRRLRETMRAQQATADAERRGALASRRAQRKEDLTARTKRDKAALTEEASTGPLGQASARARELSGKATPKGASGLSERLTDVMIGSTITPKTTPFLGKLGVGIAGALGGSSKTVQRRIAGQGAEQKAAQALAAGLRRLTKEEQIVELMNRGMTRAAALEMTGE